MISWYWIPIAFIVGLFALQLISLGAMIIQLFLSWVLYKVFDEEKT